MELQEHFENQKHEWESALQVNAPAEEPVQVNPKALERMIAKRQKLLSLQEYVDGILKGDIVILSKAITLVESSLPEYQKMVTEHVENIRKSGYLAKKRAKQDVQTMFDSIEQTLRSDFYENSLIKDMITLTENNVREKRVSAYIAAQNLLEANFNILKKKKNTNIDFIQLF